MEVTEPTRRWVCCMLATSRKNFMKNFTGDVATYLWTRKTVASLGWVTPRAATEGVTPPFFPEKPGDLFFAHRCHYHYRFLLLSLGCHPLEGVTPHLF